MALEWEAESQLAQSANGVPYSLLPQASSSSRLYLPRPLEPISGVTTLLHSSFSPSPSLLSYFSPALISSPSSRQKLSRFRLLMGNSCCFHSLLPSPPNAPKFSFFSPLLLCHSLYLVAPRKMDLRSPSDELQWRRKEE